MRNPKLPLLFVLAVVGGLVLVGLGLVVLVGWRQPDGAAKPGPDARATHAPTGSSITALTAEPLRGTNPWADTPAPSERPSATSSSSWLSAAAPMTVSYSASGSGTGAATLVTQGDADSSVAAEHDVALPWSRTVTLSDQSPIRLSVRTGSGDARCRIAVDGQVVAEQSGSRFASCEKGSRHAMFTPSPSKAAVRGGLLAAAASLALPASLAAAAPVTVAYQVLGSGKATELIYWDETGAKQTQNDVQLPWNKTVSIAKTIPIQLSVIVASGEVTCKIAVDGKPTVETKRKFSAQCNTDITGS